MASMAAYPLHDWMPSPLRFVSSRVPHGRPGRYRCPLCAISGNFSRVPVEDHKVTKIAGLRRAFGILLPGRIGDVDDHGLGIARKLEGRALTKSIAAEPLSNT
jgi:hypothetical protein